MKAIAVKLLNKYLGDYVEGFDDKFKVGILSGTVDAHHLRLKKNALDKFGLPVTVEEGYLGHVHLEIPWSSLSSKPVVIRLEDIFIRVRIDKSNPEKRKRDRLVLAEVLGLDKPESEEDKEKKAKEKAQQQEIADKLKKEDGFMQQLIIKIVNNVQIVINNLHIRYEDQVTDPKHPFAVGFTLEEIRLRSTDEHWNEKEFINMEIANPYKIVKLRNFALYWDNFKDSSSFLKYSSIEEMANQFRALIKTDKLEPDHQYILSPISGEMKAAYYKDLKTLDKPKINLECKLYSLDLSLDSQQYRSAFRLLDYFSTLYFRDKRRPKRPTQTIKQNPQQWWQFAAKLVNANIEKERTKKYGWQWSWRQIKERKINKALYSDLFKKKLEGKLTAKETEDLDELEMDKLNYDDVILTRKYVHSLVQERDRKDKLKNAKSNSTDPSDASRTTRFLGWLGFGAKSQAPQPVVEVEKPKPAPSPQKPVDSDSDSDDEYYDAAEDVNEMDEDDLWKEIYQAANINSGTDDLLRKYPKDYVKTQINLTIQRVSISLRDEKGKRDNIAVFSLLDANGVAKMREGSFALLVDLGSLFISDYHTKKGNRFDIVSPNKGAHFHTHGNLSVRGDSERLATIAIDINPPDELIPVNVRVEYKSGPLFITFSRAMIDRIVDFFDTGAPASQNLVQLAQAANNQLGQLTKAQLRYALEHRKTLKLNIDLDAPMIIIPQDIHDPTSPSLIIDLGHLQMTARPPPPQKYVTFVLSTVFLTASREENLMDTVSLSTMSDSELERLDVYFYDVFNLEMTGLNAVVTTREWSDWRHFTMEQQQALEVINNFDVNLTLKLRRKEQEMIPKIKFAGKLPMLSVNVNEGKLQTIFDVIKTVSTPTITKQKKEAEKLKPINPKLLPAMKLNTKKNITNFAQMFSNYIPEVRIADDSVTGPQSPSKSPKGNNTNQQQDEERELKKLVYAKFEISSLVINSFFTKKKPSGEVQFLPLIIVTLRQISASFNLNNRLMDLQINLKSFLAEDKMTMNYSGSDSGGDSPAEPSSLALNQEISLQRSFDGEVQKELDQVKPRYIIHSGVEHDQDQSDVSLITIRFLSVGKTSPEYRGVNNLLEIHFTDVLTANMNRLPVAALLQFIFNIVNLITTFTAKPADPQAAAAPKIEEVRVAQVQPAVADANRPIFFKLEMSMKLLKFNLIKEKSTFLMSSLNNSALNVSVMDDGQVKVGGYLGQIEIKREGRKILMTEGDKVASVLLEMYAKTASYYPGYDMLIDVKLASLKGIFYWVLIDEIVTYFSGFGVMLDILKRSASASISNAASTKMKLKVEVSNPFIRVPKNTSLHNYKLFDVHSEEIDADAYMLLDLGKISIENHFGEISEASVDVMKIEISKLNMKSMNLVRKGDEVTTKERWVLNNTNVGMQLQRILAFKVPDPQIPRLDMILNIEAIKIDLTEEQLALLFGVLGGNFTEKPLIPDKDELQHLITHYPVLQRAIQAEVPKPVVENNQNFDSKVTHNTHFEVRLANAISFSFYKNDGFYEDGTSAAMMKFAVDEFTTIIDLFNDTIPDESRPYHAPDFEKTKIRIFFDSIVLEDLRENTGMTLKKILNMTYKLPPDDPPISVSLSKQGKVIVRVEFLKPQIFLMPGTLLDFKRFIFPILADMIVSLNKFTSAGSVVVDLQDDTLLKDALPMPDPARSRSIISLIVNDPEIFVVEDPTQAKETMAFALYFQQIVLRVINPDASGKQLLELNFTSTEVVKCVLNMLTLERVSSNNLLSSTKITMHTSADKVQRKTVFDIGHINMIASYMDIKSALDIYKTFEPLITDFTAPAAPKQSDIFEFDAQPVANLSDSSDVVGQSPSQSPAKQSDIRLGTSRLNLGNVNSPINAPNPKSAPTTPRGSEGEAVIKAEDASHNLSVYIRGINFSFLNDKLYANVIMPVLKANFFQIMVIVLTYPSQKLEVHTQIYKLGIDGYNNKMAFYEPFVEPVGLRFLLNRTPAMPAVITIESADVVNINLTKPFLDILFNTLDTLSNTGETAEGDSHHLAKSKVDAHRPFLLQPFVVKNQLGTRVNYFSIANELDPQEIDNDEEKPLIVKSRRLGEIFDQQFEYKLSMQFTNILRETMIIKELNITKVGTNYFQVDSNDLQKRLLCEVTFDKGTKILTIGTNNKIFNHCNHDVDVQVTKLDGSILVIPSLGKGQTRLLPIDCLTFINIKFKPSNSEFDWSEAVKETSLVCRNKKTRVLWNYVFSQQNIRTKNSSKVVQRRTKRKNANDVKKNHTGIYAIVLYPPFILENLLCCEVHFRIQDSSSKEVLMLSSLKKGAFIDICARSAGQSLSMAIKIPGFDWSDAVPFTESQASTYSRKTFKLLDGFRRPLQLYADMLNTPSFPTCRRLVLYADYWVENKTGLMMYFKDLPYEDNDYASGQNITPKEIVKDYLQQGDPRDWYHNSSPGNSLHNSSSNISNTNVSNNNNSAVNYNTHYVELPVLQYFKPTICFKVGNSGWSSEVNITKNETGMGEATIKTARLFKFKINIDNAPGKYSRTKVVKVHPAMILVNKIDEPIYYRQRDFNNYVYQLIPKDEVPIYWFYSSNTTGQRLSISFYKDGNNLSSSQKIEDFWSLPFNLDKADFFQLKLKQSSPDPNKKFVIKLINVHVKVLRETTFVVFEKAEEPIYLIDNQTDVTFYVQQKGCKLIDSIEPRKITPYCWEDPQNVVQSANSNAEPKKLLVAAAGAQKGGMIVELNLDNPSEMPAVPLPGPEKQSARIDIKPNGGPKRVVTIYYSHAKMRRTVPILNETLQVTSELSVSLQGIGISLMSTNFYRDETSDIAGYNSSSRRQKEVMYISARGLNFKQYSTNKDVSILECLIGAFQIDNQLVPTKLPVAISSNSTLVWEKGKEFLQLRMQRSPKFNTLDFYCKLNEFELKIDQNFLIQILAFVAFIVTYFSKRSAAVEERKLFEKISQNIRSFHKLTLNDVTSNVFYLENFFINEINTHITFRSEANPDYDHNLEGFEGVLRWIPFGLLSAASNLPINLEPFTTKQTFLLQQELITRIVDHYKRWQMYAKQVWNKLDPTVVSKTNPSLNLFMDQVQGVAPEVVGVSPARFPRYFGPDQLLSVYEAEKSEGQYLVSMVNDGQYAGTEFYNFHYHVVKNKYIMLATTKLLMFIRRKEGQWYSYWVKELLEGREEKVKIVNIKAHNGKYLTCEKTGGVFANRSAASDWEEWQIEKQPQLGDKVAVRSFHGKYLSSDTFGVMAGKPEAKKWEIWRIIKLQNNPGKIAIESYEQKYMSSENILGINKVSANRSAIKTWEMWESQTIVKLAFVPLSNSYLIRERLLANKNIVQITAGLDTGKPLALDSHGNILKYDRTQWIKHIGQARYITSTQGAFFMLEQKTGLLYQWKNGNWLKKDASHEVDKIYAGSESTLVGVNSKLGKLYKWQNENWIEIQKGFEGDVNSAGINSNGDIWVATRGGHVFRFQELSGQWTFVLNILAHQVYVAGEAVIAVNEGNSNKLYKYNGSNYWDEVAQLTKSCCVSLDGVIYFVDQDGLVLQYRK